MAEKVALLLTSALLLSVCAINPSAANLTRFENNKKPSGNSSAPKYFYYVSGFDYEHRPVVVMEWGKWNIPWLVEHPKEREIFERNFDEYIEEVRSGTFAKKRLSKYLVNETEFNDEVVAIQDFDGLDLRQVKSAGAVQMSIQNLIKLQKCYAQVPYGFLVYTNPLAYQLVNIGKPFIGNFLERMEVFGTNSQKWIPQILKKIPRDQLSPAYGGAKDFKPIAVYNFVS